MASGRVVVVRNHPEGYVAAFAIATALAVNALGRAPRRGPTWGALALSTLLLAGGAWFNFVAARIPDGPPAVQLGEPPPDFTLPESFGRPVSLVDYHGRKPVVVVFSRDHG